MSDWRLEGLQGLELLEAFKREKPAVPVIMMTGWTGASATAAIDGGAFYFIRKPFNVEEIQGVIEQAIADSCAAQQLDPSADDSLLPTGAATLDLLATIDLVAASDAPALICGESGSGKELVARAIHERGRRAGAPFLAINTAAIPEHLLESELFGHVRGAFSGATQARAGLLVADNHGTVLLDEIGDMALGLQAKLLRVLQFGEVRALGSDRAQRVDVRFLAATHRSLQSCIDAGTFRDDLYHRLNVLEVRVPPLRKRRSEIPALVAHFMTLARVRNPNSPVRYLTEDSLLILAQAAWPGNVRELASAIERIVVMGRTASIGASDLIALGLAQAHSLVVEPEHGGVASLRQAQLARWTLAELNEHYVEWVLTQTNGDKAEAARVLGVNLSTLYRWRQAPKSMPPGRPPLVS